MVWVDPPPPLRAALAFEDLHAELEQSWIRSHKMQKQNMELSKKNLALKKTVRERDEQGLSRRVKGGFTPSIIDLRRRRSSWR